MLIELCQNISVKVFLRHRPSNRYCCYGNHAAGFKLIKKLFNSVSLEVNKVSLFSLLFHAGQAAIKLPSALEASKRAQYTAPGQYAPYIKGIMKTP